VADRPLLTLLLPGLDGTGWLFDRFVAVGSSALELRVLSYPRDRFLGYEALAEQVWREIPSNRPFALLGESFGGPLALRVGATAPPNLVGVVMASSFHRHPAPRWIRSLRPLAPAFFNLPLPAHAVRLLLGGADASEGLVEEVQASVAAVKGRVMAHRARAALAVDATPSLLAVRAPVLFLAGARDRLLRPQIPDEIRALRPDVVVRLLPAPHLMLQRRPHDAMRIVEEFLMRAQESALSRGGPAAVSQAG
jgi:pimeloyl-ACP methyl ester carboxylesterase